MIKIGGSLGKLTEDAKKKKRDIADKYPKAAKIGEGFYDYAGGGATTKLLNQGQKAAGGSTSSSGGKGELFTGYDDIKKPDYEPVKYGTMTAQETDSYTPGKSEWSGLQTRDPELRSKQLASMNALKNLADSGGMTLQDKANLQRVQMATATADKGRREAIARSQAAKGLTSSGGALMAQLASGQAATNQASQESADIAGQARERALKATMGAGELAGKLRTQDFGEDAEKAKALDAMTQFNIKGKMSNDQFNAAQRQAAEVFNTNTGNKEIDTNNALLQQEFMNSMAQQDGRAKAFMAYYQQLQAAGDRDARAKAGQMSGLFTIGGAVIGGLMTKSPQGAAAGAQVGSSVSGAANK